MRHTFLIAVAGALIAGGAPALPAMAAPAKAAPPLPTPLAPAPPLPTPQDIPYPGELQIAVDATDLAHGIFSIKETIPVSGAPMVLTYPRWLPGEHSPNGMIDKVAGLIVRGDGARIEWTRDPVDMFAFHIDPKGAKSIEVEFQFLSPLSTKEGRVVMTPEMLNAQWISLALYPAGYFTRGIRIASAIKLPQGWRYATALETDHADGQWTHFKATTFETFADSPLIAGKHFKQIDLDPGAARPVRFNVIADSPDELEMTPQQIEAHRNLVRQADRNFGSRHYDHYDFLLSLSDKMGGTGLEHHQSSENGTSFKYFTDWENGVAERDLLAHEYTHSWNGKFRRGADLWTPTFNTPMRNSLLWMYEGQTQYWGFVLGARSGLMSKQEALDAFAETAAEYDHMRGRVWKALIDTTNDPIVDDNRTLGWPSWQRYEDYYSEGQLGLAGRRHPDPRTLRRQAVPVRLRPAVLRRL